MTQLNARLPDGREVETIRPLGAAFVAHALKQTPQKPADADLALAREAVAKVSEINGDFALAAFARRGAFDDDSDVQIALAAVRLARAA